MNLRMLKIAVAIPVVGLLLLIARAEYKLRAGEPYQIPLTGYDPRDVLHGHYLRYQYELNWSPESECGDPERPSEGCCLCLTPVDGSRHDPLITQRSCDDARASCQDWLHARELMPPRRYFVPEARALELESLLRDRPAAIELTCGPDGTAAVSELLIDGQPWRASVD